MVLDEINRNIVELHGVGDGDEGAVRDPHAVWLIVVTPVADILDTLFGQNVWCVKRFGQTRSHPATWGLASIGFDGVDAAANHLTLVRLCIEGALDKAVTQHLT